VTLNARMRRFGLLVSRSVNEAWVHECHFTPARLRRAGFIRVSLYLRLAHYLKSQHFANIQIGQDPLFEVTLERHVGGRWRAELTNCELHFATCADTTAALTRSVSRLWCASGL
jgi:hypothetical protein